jgi:hypothetical protein
MAYRPGRARIAELRAKSHNSKRKAGVSSSFDRGEGISMASPHELFATGRGLWEAAIRRQLSI